MSSNLLKLKSLLQKYLNNSLNFKEQKEFWHLMSELSAKEMTYLDLHQLWDKKDDPDSLSSDVNWEKVYKKLQARIEEEQDKKYRIGSFAKKRLYRVGVAAALLGAVCLAAFYLSNKPDKASTIVSIEKQSPNLHTITLPDGSSVTLNRGSNLHYNTSYNISNREVELTGEAYFDVKPDTSRPFIVRSGKIVTTVLGTAFNIRAFPEDADVSVSVTRGKVHVQRAEDMSSLGFLGQGEQAVLKKASSETIISKVDIQKVLEWKNAELIFDNILFGEAAIPIAKKFNVAIRFENELLKNCRFTGDFEKDNLEETMEIITALTASTWNKANDSLVLISGAGCKE